MKHSLWVVTVFLSTFTLACSATNKILVHGHRGARAARPENTLAAFKYALEVGVDVLEMDLSVTKDNHLVVMHDPYINPSLCLDENKKRVKQKLFVRTMTLNEVKKFDCGSLINPKFKNQILAPGSTIPTLDEVFEFVKNSNIQTAKKVEFNIETKTAPDYPNMAPSAQNFADLVVKSIETHNMVSRTIVQSFDHRTIYWVKKKNSSIRTSQLSHRTLVDLVGATQAVNADYLSPNHNWISRDMVQRLHKAKIKVAPWTANEPRAWKQLVDLKVDAIITDDPKALIDFLKLNKAY